MEPTSVIDRDLFNALQNIDIDLLEDKDLTHVLPFLTKLFLNKSFTKRQQVLKLLYPIRKTNDVIQYLRSKPAELQDDISTSNFESSNYGDRLKIVAKEYCRIQEIARQSNSKLQTSDLFDNPLYIDEVSFCLYAFLVKSTNLPVINILDLSEALLHVKHGPTYIVRLVANMPDRCQEVCQSLIAYGERQDEGNNEISEQRAKTLEMLCLMNPSIAFTVRSLTLQLCKVPSLTVMITLNHLSEAINKYDTIINEQISEAEDVIPTATKELEDTYDSAVAFITGILLGADEGIRAWFSQFIKSAQQKRIDQSQYSILTGFRSQLLVYINRLFPYFLENELGEKSSSNITPQELNKKLIRATATLRAYCALRGIGLLKLNQEESEILLRLVTCKPEVNQTSVNFATTGVCTLIACSAMINNQKEEKRAAEWLKWLIKDSNYSRSEYSSHGKCSISELLLLIAIHFQNNQTNQISELICTTLGMKLSIKASVSKCKSLFVQEVFNDQMVAEHAVKVPVTKNLDNSITEFLPIHCIHQLLESRSFSKYQIPIKDWIFRQICESKKPIHHMLPKLIEAYVNSILIPTTLHGHCGTNQPICEEDITRVFETHLYSSDSRIDTSKKGDNKEANVLEEPTIVDFEVTQILLLYYLLLYEDVKLKRTVESERNRVFRYSQDFMMEIPVFYLLQLVRDNQDSFGTILPDLLRLVASQYPQLFTTQHWLTPEVYEPYRSKTSYASSKLGSIRRPSERTKRNDLKKQLDDGFDNIDQNPISLARTINILLSSPRDEIWTFVDPFIENWTRILNLKPSSKSDHKVVVQFTTKLWWKLNTIFPRKLWVMTVNSLKRMQARPEYSWDELAMDPLIVLRCDTRVFRCPHVLDIVLHILSAFLAASKRLHDQTDDYSSHSIGQRNIEELRTTLVLAQTSASIQILLELCLPNENEQEVLNKKDGLTEDEMSILDSFDASVNCICEHLHQVFIADTNLAKLVHFQTYPCELLATTCEKIPSMHICLDFIPELLSQPELGKQVFVIQLTSHLCEKYPITKSLNVAKLCFDLAYTLLQLLPSGNRAVFYLPVLPALLRMSKVFPILREDAGIILNQINEITLAHMASTSSRLSLGSSRPFEGLDKMSWPELKKLTSSLNIQESLYFCIQKCLVELTSRDVCNPQPNTQTLLFGH